MIVGCLELELEGQSCLVDDVDRGLMKIDQLGHMTKEDPEKYCFNRFFHIDSPKGTGHPSANGSKKKFGNLLAKLWLFHQLAPAFRSNSWRFGLYLQRLPQKDFCSVSLKIVGRSLLSFFLAMLTFFFTPTAVGHASVNRVALVISV